MEKLVRFESLQRYYRIWPHLYSVSLFFLFLVLVATEVRGQDGPLNIPSPEAAAFMKSGNVPVSTFTGVANISIPLFTIKDGPIELPIILSYNSSGIRVDEQAGWSGLGFNLSYGGQLTRSIRGSDDFSLSNSFRKYASAESRDSKMLFDGTPQFNGDQFQRYAILSSSNSTNGENIAM